MLISKEMGHTPVFELMCIAVLHRLYE